MFNLNNLSSRIKIPIETMKNNYRLLLDDLNNEIKHLSKFDCKSLLTLTIASLMLVLANSSKLNSIFGRT
ncbi:hypothetical protein GCM10027284_39620 [Cyclobacterium sediminis]